MIQNSSISVRSKKSAITLAITIFVSLYWFLSIFISVYSSPLVGAIYEILWIGMVIGLFGLPIFSFIFWTKTKFSLRSLYFYSFVISITSVLFLVTRK
jgi:hypothetical protein